MRSKNPYSDGNLEEKSENIKENFDNIEETEENQHEIKNNKFFEFLQTLKFKGLKVIGFLVNTLNLGTEKISKLSDTRLAIFIKEKWQSETNIYEIYLIYRELNVVNINKIVKEYFNLNEKIFDSKISFNDTRDELKRIRTGKLNIDTRELEGELHRLEKEIKEMKETRDSIPKWLLKMGYKKENIVLKLGSKDKEFVLECLQYNSKIVIAYVVIVLISLLYFLLHWNEFYLLGTILGLAIVTWIYYKVICKVEFMAVKRYVNENINLKNEIREDYREALVIVDSYGNKKVDEIPKVTTKKKPESSKSNTSIQPTVQQPKQEEVYDNPYADMWKEINTKYFKLEDFRVPEFEKLELIERHTIHDYDLKEEDVVKINENIEKYRGVPINIIKSKNGKIIVDFLIGKFPNLIPFNEVPKVDENFIVVGKSAEGWITWNLITAPHGLIVGTTGSGKSNTVRFVFNEFQKKKNYLMYVIDFKGGSDYYFLDGKYKLITDTERFIDFIKKLDSELTYRQKLFKDLRSSEIDRVNDSLKKKGENTVPHLMVFMDEFAFVSSLPKEVKNSVIKTIEQLMQRGRSFGMHFTLIVQKPTAENLGSSYIRSLIGFRLIGKLEDEADYEKSFGASNNLTGQDKVFANKMKNEADFLGKFIVKGGHTENEPLGRNIIVRIPFMDVGDYNEMVLNEWEDNPYADYELHYDEEEMTEDEKFLNDKIYGKENKSSKKDSISTYSREKEDAIEVECEVVDEDDDDVQDYPYDMSDLL